jgi:hypothetical protein
MFVFVLSFVDRGLRDSRGDLPGVLIRLRNLRCETDKVLTRTVEPLMMMMMMMMIGRRFHDTQTK